MTRRVKTARRKPRVKRSELPIQVLELPPPWRKVSASTLARSRMKHAGTVPVAFQVPQFPKGVAPRGVRNMARDGQVIETNAWAAEQVYNGAFFNGVTFMGYTYLSELAQRPEYRRFSEVLATEMTRKWIRFTSTDTDKGAKKAKLDRIKELEKEIERLNVKTAFRKMVEIDGFFGRAHLYLDTGDREDRDELKRPIGDGKDATTRMKFGDTRGFLREVKAIEPVWCYPAQYNANDPLRSDWYNPQSWLVQGKELHSTRLLTFVGREVPDLLKPSYAFGGLSLSQMAKPYVDNFLRTRDAVGDLVQAFTNWILKTDLAASAAADGGALFDRAELFANLKNNLGLMVVDKNTEDFDNVSASLGSLDQLQAQSQEHMCSVVGIPVVKLLGIQPAGLNASSEGELTVWYEWVEAYQKKFFTDHLWRVLHFVQMSLWGEIDEDITWSFEPLRSLSALEQSTKRKTDAETGAALIQSGAIDPEEERARLAADPESPYSGLLEEERVSDYDDHLLDDIVPEAQAALGQEREPDERRDGDEPRGEEGAERTDREPRPARGGRARGNRAREPRSFA